MYECAFHKKFKASRKVSFKDGDRKEDDVTEEHDFQELQGKRLRRSKALFSNADFCRSMVVLAILTEPFQMLTQFSCMPQSTSATCRSGRHS